MNLGTSPDQSPLRVRLRAVADVLEIAPASVMALLLLASCAGAGLLALWWIARPAPVSSGVPAGLAVATAAPSETVSSAGDSVVVHVSGAVATPGIHQLRGGARVDDAITVAGGADRGALLDQLNLARPLRDGEQIHVPAAGDAASDAAVAQDGSGLVNLNRASVTELEELPGVGPVLAERIIAHRETNGGFRSVNELQQVSGIGEKTFAELQDLVTV